jgi:hypothetical protein
MGVEVQFHLFLISLVIETTKTSLIVLVDPLHSSLDLLPLLTASVHPYVPLQPSSLSVLATAGSHVIPFASNKRLVVVDIGQKEMEWYRIVYRGRTLEHRHTQNSQEFLLIGIGIRDKC